MRAAVIGWFIGLLALFVLLSRVAEYSLPATVLYTLLLYPGIVVQVAVAGNPDSVGVLVLVASFIIDFAVGVAVIAAIRGARSER